MNLLEARSDERVCWYLKPDWRTSLMPRTDEGVTETLEHCERGHVSVPLFSAAHSPLTAANSQRKQERPEQLGVGTDILFRRRSPSSLT